MRSARSMAWKGRLDRALEYRRKLTLKFGKGISMVEMASMEARDIIARLDGLSAGLQALHRSRVVTYGNSPFFECSTSPATGA